MEYSASAARCPEHVYDTCGDTVKRVWQQVIELLPLLNGWTAAVDLVQGGVCMMHPLHQPLELAVAYQVVAPQIPAGMKGPHGTSVNTLMTKH